MTCPECGGPTVGVEWRPPWDRARVVEPTPLRCEACAAAAVEAQAEADRAALGARTNVGQVKVYPTFQPRVDGALAALERRRFAYVGGEPLSGKSTLCRAVIRQGAERWGCTGRYVLWADLLGREVDEEWAACAAVGVLALDSVGGRQPLTDKQMDRLQSLLERRNVEGFRTIVSTFLPPKGLEAYMGDEAWARFWLLSDGARVLLRRADYDV